MASSPLLQFLQFTLSAALDLRSLLLLCLVASCVTVDIAEGQYTVITATDSFPPSSFLHVVTPEALSKTTTVNVWLAAGQSFLLVDKTAKLLQSPPRFKVDAYPYVNKQCQFDTTVKLADLFPEVPTTHVYWTQPTVTDAPSVPDAQKPSTSISFWKFTNPGEGLNKKVRRFCYSFWEFVRPAASTQFALAAEGALMEAEAHNISPTAAAEITRTERAETQANVNTSAAGTDATKTPVVVLIFHSGSLGFGTAGASTVLALLSLTSAWWLAS